MISYIIVLTLVLLTCLVACTWLRTSIVELITGRKGKSQGIVGQSESMGGKIDGIRIDDREKEKEAEKVPE